MRSPMGVRGPRTHEFRFNADFANLGKAPEKLDCVVDFAANPVGGGEVALAFDTKGNGLKVVERCRRPQDAHQRRS